ncbi:TonB-dependent receptor family protein [Alteromonas oceanisediminis]|uniref:TonB-dependent receptor family protein n=1 Tax=Alteromonas oceanisediminis TaxID=2836180 RepID=UPI001BDB206E|nr:TonB-dependent receptor [Alteromonas oceanisediminis]MBT0586269.1 TonB-dependent receptor [Alteromonas oceanisediminis]
MRLNHTARRSAAILLCSAYSSAIFAQDSVEQSTPSSASIETITVLGDANTQGATLGGIDLKTLPINSHVVGRVELERLRFVDPDEFLDRIPGETQVRNLRIPNGGKGYTIPMLDGIALENPYEGATQRLDRTNTFDIERVEIIKGPASALYPNNAFGGVINVVSRDAPLTSETLISAEAGDFNRFRARVSTGGTVQKVGYFFDANLRELDGLREGAKNDREQVSGKLIFSSSDVSEITTRAEYLSENRIERGDLTEQELADDPTQAGSLSASTDLTQSTLSGQWEYLMPNGQFDVHAVRREKDTVGASRFRGPQDENDLAYSAKIQYRHDFTTSNLISGYERYDGEQDVKQYARNDLGLQGTFDTFTNQLTIDALYLQYQKELTDTIIITAGARYEDIQQSHSDFTLDANYSDIAPKLGLTYAASPNLMLWASASEGFYAPSVDDIFIDAELRDLLDIQPEAILLAPEEALNLEAGIRGSIGSWQFDTSAYHTNIDNYLVTQEFIEALSSGEIIEYQLTTNAGEVTIKGIESVLEFAPKNAPYRIGVTHTYTRNEYDSFVQSTPGAADDLTGKILRRSPDHHLNIRVAWLPIEELVIELEGDYYSDYFADDANSEASRFTRGERINLRVNYQWNDWRVWFHALNLTDTLEDRATFRRGSMSFRTIDGRTLYAGASFTF